jgi:hypothetical protein
MLRLVSPLIELARAPGRQADGSAREMPEMVASGPVLHLAAGVPRISH